MTRQVRMIAVKAPQALLDSLHDTINIAVHGILHSITHCCCVVHHCPEHHESLLAEVQDVIWPDMTKLIIEMIEAVDKLNEDQELESRRIFQIAFRDLLLMARDASEKIITDRSLDPLREGFEPEYP